MRDTDHPFVSAALLAILAFLVRLGLDPWLSNRSPFLVFTVAIVIAAGRYGVGPGILTIGLSLLLGTVAFVARGDFSSIPPEALAGLCVFLATAAAMLIFAAHLKASQQRTIRLQAELQEAYTQTAVGTMASILAHELNQPLAAATNYIAASRQLAQNLKGEEKERVLGALEDSEAQIRRAGDIIRHARDLVRNASTERQPVSLKSLIGRVTNPLLASGAYDQARIRTEIESGADKLVANPVQIEQVLMNLLRNACQAAGNGGGAEIVVAARPEGASSIIEVRDRAGGIDPQRFAALFTTEGQSTHGGLGLGLSISRAIIEAHGGRIWTENNNEGGASFFFTVPRGG